jgi:hypothetical protein
MGTSIFPASTETNASVRVGGIVAVAVAVGGGVSVGVGVSVGIRVAVCEGVGLDLMRKNEPIPAC